MNNQKKEDKLKPLSKDEFEGSVMWFRDDYGYGFINCEKFPKPVFVHYARIMSDERFKTLSKGQFVVFQVVSTEKGYMAVNVRDKKVIPVEAKVIS